MQCAEHEDREKFHADEVAQGEMLLFWWEQVLRHAENRHLRSKSVSLWPEAVVDRRLEFRETASMFTSIPPMSTALYSTVYV